MERRHLAGIGLACALAAPAQAQLKTEKVLSYEVAKIDLHRRIAAAAPSWLAPGGYNRDTGNVVLCYQSYVVKTPHHNILVDACIGNDKNFPLRPRWNKKNDSNWMNALKAAGLGSRTSTS